MFAGLVDEEVRRDEAHRKTLNEDVEARQALASASASAPLSIPIPKPILDNSDEVTTPRASGQYPPTPALAIGLATPAPAQPNLPDVPEDQLAAPMSPLEKRASHASRQSVEREDYFTSIINTVDSVTKGAAPQTPAAETTDPKTSTDGKDADKEKEKDNGKSPSTPFGKKFRMSFGTKKLGRSASQATQEKPVIVEEKAEESESSSVHEKEVDDSFLGAIQKIRQEYEKQLAEFPEKLVESALTPSLPNDTPVLKLPPGTKVVIQEETTGGSANIYQGTVEHVGKDADLIEQKAPMWLGSVLLQNVTPFKEPVKISFVLIPMEGLPPIAVTDGNNRLNANRMLRVKKILAYVAERIEPQSEEPDPGALKPEEYLELYCNEQVSCASSLDPISMPWLTCTSYFRPQQAWLLSERTSGRAAATSSSITTPTDAKS